MRIATGGLALALCALVGRLQTEEDEWEGREEEPQRLLRWLESHGADAALSDAERAWLLAPVDALPYAAWGVGSPAATRSPVVGASPSAGGPPRSMTATPCSTSNPASGPSTAIAPTRSRAVGGPPARMRRATCRAPRASS